MWKVEGDIVHTLMRDVVAADIDLGNGGMPPVLTVVSTPMLPDYDFSYWLQSRSALIYLENYDKSLGSIITVSY